MMEQQIPAGQADGKSATETDRRVWVRHASSRETFCRPHNTQAGELAWSADVRDVSVGGVGLVLPRRFEPGTILSVELPGPPAEGRAPAVLARVRHATAQGGGRWLLGCHFLCNLADDELEAIQ